MTHNNVIKLYGDTAETQRGLSRDPESEQLFDQMIDGYSKYRLTTRKHQEKTVTNDLRLVRQFAEYTGKFPWQWRIDDWDNWNFHLFQTRNITRATQRKNQGSIRNFIRYITSREVFRQEVKTRFDIEIDQFIDDEEILHHLFDKEQKEPRLAFSPEMMDKFFNTLREEIRRESTGKPRVLANLQRDLALFYLLKATGLRISSILALNIHSFGPNPSMPEMGNFGQLVTIGKGSKGSGGKTLSNLIDDIKVPPMLGWYIKEVRPQYLKPSNPDEQALFLSERGKRLSYASCWDRLQKRLADADLIHLKLCNHSFRHSKASQSGMDYGIETTRRMLGHEFASTTQGYMSIPDEYCQGQVNAAIRKQIEKVAHKDTNQGKDLEGLNKNKENQNDK